MPHPLVVHCKREKFDVYIGRPGKWGNPFTIPFDGSREEVIEKYRAWIQTQPELFAALSELRGKVLGCWCAPLACHGDILAELANGTNDFHGITTSKLPASARVRMWLELKETDRG